VLLEDAQARTEISLDRVHDPDRGRIEIDRLARMWTRDVLDPAATDRLGQESCLHP
jgi:hypothetical protein